jgi:Protein of unknown function (DUF3551)
MRKLVIAGLLTAAMGSVFLGGTKNADAYEGPWCHYWGGGMGGIENCRLETLEMCRYEITGNGGSCSPNPRYQGNLPEQSSALPRATKSHLR